MKKEFVFGSSDLPLTEISDFVHRREHFSTVSLSPECQRRVDSSHKNFLQLLEKNIPIYGVTTGFGDSCHQSIPAAKSDQLQSNLISYLLCGTGAMLTPETARGVLLIRLNSLSRGYSGVSPELLERLRLYLENDWVPVIPREGSLGASGDLIPLAYLAQNIQGHGKVYVQGQVQEMSEVLKNVGVKSYRLKPKEGLALVNGTSTMAALALVNWNEARFLTELTCLSSAWLCLSLQGRTEPFGELVNEKAKNFSGQKRSAFLIRQILQQENYQTKSLNDFKIKENKIQDLVQDRYSLRCAPQVLGPVFDTLSLLEDWLQTEINGVSDNPLIDEDGQLQMGGNFYGGYLSQGMDYLKISLAQIADLVDRQLMSLVDEKANRGLPPNLVAWNVIPKDDHYLHHGLKGLHQAVSAITSEILARSTPNSIFSRSSESHNQDKVSLGMSAAVQCTQILEPLYTILAMHLICLAQGLELRGIQVKGKLSQRMFAMIRKSVPFLTQDSPLDMAVVNLALNLKKWSKESFLFIDEEL